MNALLKTVAHYYERKLETYGATALGVDWKNSASQRLRFKQLITLLSGYQEVSLLDYGCGYGALLDWPGLQTKLSTYIGMDISKKMVEHAQQNHRNRSYAHFEVGSQIKHPIDFIISSGIFNVRSDESDSTWLDYIFSTLAMFNANANKGFSFNLLTAYSDQEKMQPHLYYANPCEIFDYCKRHFARKVTLLHDYDLYEFTIIVKKE